VYIIFLVNIAFSPDLDFILFLSFLSGSRDIVLQASHFESRKSSYLLPMTNWTVSRVSSRWVYCVKYHYNWNRLLRATIHKCIIIVTCHTAVYVVFPTSWHIRSQKVMSESIQVFFLAATCIHSPQPLFHYDDHFAAAL